MEMEMETEIEKKINFIKNKLVNAKYIQIEEIDSVDKIYSLYKNNKEKSVNKNIEFLYYGFYFNNFVPNIRKMKYYYKCGIDNSCYLCSFNLSCYFFDNSLINKYLKYAKKSSDLGSTVVDGHIAEYYLSIKNYKEYEIYIQKAISKKDICSMINYANYLHKNNDDRFPEYLNFLENVENVENKENFILKMFLANHYFKNKKYDKMKEIIKTTLKSKENIDAYKISNYLMGKYHLNIEKNYKLAKEYLKSSVEFGHLNSILILGKHYKYVENNFSEAEKYFKLGAEIGSITSILELGKRYTYEDGEKAKMYYLLTIEKGSLLGMYLLANYFEVVEQNYEMMKKYYNMAIEDKSEDNIEKITIRRNCIESLLNYYKNVEKNEKFIIKYENKKNEIIEKEMKLIKN